MTTINLVNGKVWFDSKFIETGISISDGVIKKIAKEHKLPEADSKFDVKGKMIFPGFIDTHTHLRDAGYSYKEDFGSGTSAAVAGGFTTVLDMPNTSPPITRAEALRKRIQNAKGKIYCDVGFYSTTNDPSMVTELAEESVAFKAYLHKAIDSVMFDPEKIENLIVSARKSGRLVCFHAEDRNLIDKNAKTPEEHLDAHPVRAEVSAIEQVIRIASKTQGKVHICHLSTKEGLELIRKARKFGVDISCEATPHHMLLDSTTVAELGGIAVVEPPLRTAIDSAAILDGVSAGLIPIIATDHAPHALREKGNENPHPGFPQLETLVGLLFTLVNQGRISVKRAISAITENPASRFNLDKIGAMKEGFRANLTILDPKKNWKIDSGIFYTKARYSPFNGRIVRGKVFATIIRGRVVYEEGEIVSKPDGEVVYAKVRS
ncbi:MAG: amidohydrolase family protein [Thaumarchaeota archaeon]|nr:amidohydrolase family protein [Nitrososphaerota archaeon]